MKVAEIEEKIKKYEESNKKNIKKTSQNKVKKFVESDYSSIVFDMFSAILTPYLIYRYVFGVLNPFKRLDFIIFVFIFCVAGLYFYLKKIKNKFAILRNENRSNTSV